VTAETKDVNGNSYIGGVKLATGNAYLLFDYTPPERITVETIDPTWLLREAEVGDLVTVNDDDVDLSGAYRIYGKELTYDGGLLKLTLELSNTQLSVMGEIKKSADQTAKLDKYMQGSTNVYQVSSYENCDSSHYLNMRFYLPDDVKAINKVLLSYKILDYRAYTGTTPAGGGTTSGPSSKTTSDAGSAHTHTLDIGPSGSHSHTISSHDTGNWDIAEQESRQMSYTSGSSSVSPSTWTSITNFTGDSGGGIELFSIQASASNGGVGIYFRLYDSTAGRYFPSNSSDGSTPPNLAYCPYIRTAVTDTSDPATIVFAPPTGWNDNGHTVYLQAYADTSTTLSVKINRSYLTASHTHGISSISSTSDTHSHPGLATASESSHTHGMNHTHTIPDHTHDMTYAIDTSAGGSSGTVDIYIGEDGSESLYKSGQSSLTNEDITSAVLSAGVGKWINIQFRPSTKMRIEANAYIKCFVQSRT